jgi:Transposase DDE domain
LSRHRHRFEAYLDKVFGFSDLVSALPEGRQFPQHSWKKVFDAVFLGAAMQIPSLLQIEAECHHGALSKRIGPISDDTLGYTLERQSPEPVFALGCEIARRLKRNGVLRSDWSRGLVVGAVDGIEICSSFARCCDACMEREIQPKVNGEVKTEIQYYHRIVVVVLVSTEFPIPLGVRFQKNGEGEVACALALVQDLVGQLGRRFLDVLVGDALYLQAPFVQEVERLGLVWAFTLKENQPELLHEAERLTQESPTGVQEEPDREIRYWHLPEVDWPVADRQIRVVKTVRIEQQHRVTVSAKDAARIKGKMAMSQPSTNFYATNFDLGSISPLFLHQLSRSRWRIDTEVFQTITTDCHLKHPAVHQTTALVVLTMIRFLAYTLSLVFYHRQVRSHARRKCDTFHQLAKRFAYWFLAVSPNTS